MVKDEVYGNQIDAEAFISKVDECLASLEPTYQLNDEVFIQPTIFASDERFKQALPAAQTLISGEI